VGNFAEDKNGEYNIELNDNLKTCKNIEKIKKEL
jgi:hypothetical protein